MDPSHLTQKSAEALHDAQTKALRFGHTEVDSEHLLLALLDQAEGIAPRLLSQAGADPDRLRTALEAELSRRPRVSGPGVTPGQGRVQARLAAWACPRGSAASRSGCPACSTRPSRRRTGSRTSTSRSSTCSWRCSRRARPPRPTACSRPRV